MGKVEMFRMPINIGPTPRKVWVYLPDSYAYRKKKYDVLYMFDGHNIFYDQVATYGKSWGLKEYLDQTGIDLVVVGVDCNHKGDGRLSEYCPYKPEITHLEDLPQVPPLGRKTAKWFVEKLKPEIEKRYHVHSDRKHVGIAGSSMGGLMSEYMITAHNDVFSKAGCVSPSTHFCYSELSRLINETDFNPDTWIYIDQGSQEVHGKRLFIDAMDMMLHINHMYNEKGCHTYPHLTPGGHHCEADWERIVPVFIPYLYPHLFNR